MFHHVAVALLGGALTIGLGWGFLGVRALALAPFVASLGTLALAILLDRRASRSASATSWIRDLQAGPPAPIADNRRVDPAALCRRRA